MLKLVTELFAMLFVSLVACVCTAAIIFVLRPEVFWAVMDVALTYAEATL